MVCNVACGCSQTFNRVDQFEKHVEKDCPIMQDIARGITGHEQEHLLILGLKKALTSNAIQVLNQQLERLVSPCGQSCRRSITQRRTRSQKRGPSDKATESQPSNETSNTTIRGPKCKRTREGTLASLCPLFDHLTDDQKVSLSARDTKRRCSGQERSKMDEAISPLSHFNCTVHPGSLNDLGSISSCKLSLPGYGRLDLVIILQLSNIKFSADIGSIVDMQTDKYVAGNNPEATQASGNSIPQLYPNEPTNDISVINGVGVNPPTPGSDHIDRTQPPPTGDTEDQWHYRTGFEWSDFNACDCPTIQDRWNDFTSMHNPEHYYWGVFNAEREDSRERWSYLSNDWNPFNAAFDDFNNILSSNI